MIVDHLDEMNKRIFNRNLPGGQMSMSIDSRPVSTKYMKLPVHDIRRSAYSETPIHISPNYVQEQTFLPGGKAPWSGFKVDAESDLRNQFFALQRANQAEFVPHLHSDLYHITIPTSHGFQPHQLLFEEPKLATKQMDSGVEIFYNDTRAQRRPANLSK